MITYKIYTLGCKVAQAEGAQLKLLLNKFGCSEAAPSEAPELCLVNTCAVTSTAAGKSRRLLRKLARLYPKSKILLLGCYASIADDSVISSIPQIALYADHRKGIFSAVENFLSLYVSNKGKTPVGSNNHNISNLFDASNIKHVFTPKVKDKFSSSRHRAFLKIQDGCNAMCSYCIIPYFRPNLSSLPIEDAVAQTERFIAAGHKEIVLCGIFLGAYGRTTAKRARLKDKDQPLVELIRRLIRLEGLERLRLSSLEPLDLTDELLAVLSDTNKTAGHLHLPLQSGSNRILTKMARQYTAEEYLHAINRANKYFSKVAFTTDVIIGFPTETEEDFQETLRICRQVGFLKIHIFPFSPRERTVAYKWNLAPIAPEIVKDRLSRIHTLEANLRQQFCDRFENEFVRVLVERTEYIPNSGKWKCVGRADQYFEVQFEAKENLDNKIVYVKITDTKTQPITGNLMEDVSIQ